MNVRCVLLALLLAASPREAAAADEIFWYKDVKQASAAALKADLPLLIDFWADWCAPCKEMDTQVYRNPRVVAAFKDRLIGVRLNFDLQPDMARKFNVEGLPNLVFTDSYGTRLVSHLGSMSVGDLVDVVNALPPLAAINRLDLRLQQNQNSFADLLMLARALRASALFDASQPFYQRALKQDRARTDAAVREAILYETALNYLELRDGKRAVSVLERCLREFPRSPQKPDFLRELERARALTAKVQDRPAR